jgi:hypothetical protein
MGQESGTLRVTRRAAWLLRLLPDLQEARTQSAFSGSSSIHRMLVRFSLPFDFVDSSAWISRHFVVFRSRCGWSRFMDLVETLTLWPDPALEPTADPPSAESHAQFHTCRFSRRGPAFSSGLLCSAVSFFHRARPSSMAALRRADWLPAGGLFFFFVLSASSAVKFPRFRFRFSIFSPLRVHPDVDELRHQMKPQRQRQEKRRPN